MGLRSFGYRGIAGIALGNPSTVPAYVLATLWNPDTGSPLTATVISVPPNGHIARFATELFTDTPIVSHTRAKISLDSCSSASCTFAGGNGFLATALRLNGDQFTTVPVTERPDGGDKVRILPEVAFGGPAGGLNMKTILYFTTNVSTGVFGATEIFDDDGNPLMATADGAPPASSITFTVPGNRVTRVVLSGDETLRAGWIRLTLSGDVHLVANAIFQTYIGSDLVAEASVLETPQVQRGLVHVKVQPGTNVGVALANPGSSPSTITLDFFNSQGSLAESRNITLPPNGHLARFVTEIFPGLASLAEFTGALSIHGADPFSPLALRLTGDKIAALAIAANGMHRPTITGLRISATQRLTPATVTFSIDVADLDQDLATASATSVNAVGYMDFGPFGADYGLFTIDGTAMVARDTGSLTGSFHPPNVTGNVPAGTQAVLYLQVFDALGNISNIVVFPFRF